MIHIGVQSPFWGHRQMVLFGKGPSFHPKDNTFFPSVGVNEAALANHCTWGAIRDWTMCEKIGTMDYQWTSWIIEQRIFFRGGACSWANDVENYYFDGHRVLGLDQDSKSVPGRKLGVGTATAVLQMMGEAGVEKVFLCGFDNFWGDETPAYHDVFQEMGCVPGDYAERFPLSGTPVEQLRLVRESMQYVIAKKGLTVERV